MSFVLLSSMIVNNLPFLKIGFPALDYCVPFIALAKSTTEDGETCLHLTAISSSVEISKMVLEKGADPNARSTAAKVKFKFTNSISTLYFISIQAQMS